MSTHDSEFSLLRVELRPLVGPRPEGHLEELGQVEQDGEQQHRGDAVEDPVERERGLLTRQKVAKAAAATVPPAAAARTV